MVPVRVAHLRILCWTFQIRDILSYRMPGSDSPDQIEFEKVLPENKSLGFRMINVNVDSPSSPTFPYQEMLFCFSILQPTKWVSYPVLYFTTQITPTSELTKTLSCKTMTDSEKNARKSTRRCASKTCKDCRDC